MKNVAGYDVSRLMAGAFGTLGVLLDISIKVMPRPQHESTRVFALDRDAAHTNVVAWARTPLPLSATCHVDGVLHVRLSGTEKGVRAAAAKIGGEEMAHAGGVLGFAAGSDTPVLWQRDGVFALPCRPPRNIPPSKATG